MRKDVFPAVLFFVLAVFAAAVFAQEGTADVSGEWEVTIESPRGPMTSTAKFVQDGEKITVTMTGPRGGESTGEGTFKGNAITWTITRSTPRGEMTVTYKGTVEGTTMSGTAEMGNFGTVGWKATKK
ncbi:MAG: hypothetical protein AB1715_09690 [Acidobacteriota bacterium]